VKAHQREIRETEAGKDPRPTVPLEGCTVQAVTRAEATRIILRYEWLGTIPSNAQAFYGLVAPDGDLLGVSVFGVPPGTASRDLCGPENREKVIALVRGACVHYAHPHAGSFLTARACTLAAGDHGWRVFVAYQDLRAGEIGTIYQACNWHFIGATGRGSSGYRTRYRTPEGAWWTSRRFRALKRREGQEWDFYAAAGWSKGREPDKGKYVYFEGTPAERRALRKQLKYPILQYPKRPSRGGPPGTQVEK
jgi:hypothetical protein